MLTLDLEPSAPRSEASVFYRAVWRWHFYAGVVVAPFAIFLAITGGLYLWKPQYEDWRYADLLRAPAAAAPVSLDRQLAAAQTVFPHSRPIQIIPALPGRTTEVQFGERRAGGRVSVYVDPGTGRVLGAIPDSARTMQTIHDLHGTLLAGPAGQLVVELVASWALVLFVTGIYLWWPRPRFRVGGFLLPRWRVLGRAGWRDWHAVPAVWLSVASVFLLVTGLLWTKAAGSWYRTISMAMGQGTPRETAAAAHRSELVGWSPPLGAGLAEKIDRLHSDDGDEPEHAEHRNRRREPGADSAWTVAHPSIALDRVAAIATAHAVPVPYAIAFPVGREGVFSVLSDRNRAFDRTYLHLDRYSGRVLAEVRYGDFGYLARFFGWGIIAHEGQLFGLANQIAGSVAAAGVVLLGLSGLAMWWLRRPRPRFGPPVEAARFPRSILLIVGLLACLLPLLAASLVLVAGVELGRAALGRVKS